MSKTIKIKGARTHNLKDLDVEIPREKFVVITGLSGSGKSSLAFDTLYAEGQRRYVESLSAYARQFLGVMEKPDVDVIEGLSPAISIDQKTTSKNPRSTVGTITEINDHLRLLFARIGKPNCPNCQKEIKGQTIEQIINQIKGQVIIAAPIIRKRKGTYQKVFEDLLKEGFTRVIVDGSLFKLEDPPTLERNLTHDISVVVDRVEAKEENKARLAHSVELALNKGGDLVEVYDFKDLKNKDLHSRSLACPDCGYTLKEMEPRFFSFNSPEGACSKCQGLGHMLEIDPDLLIADQGLSINQGALNNFNKLATRYDKKGLINLAAALGINLDTAWNKLPSKKRQELLFGSPKKITIEYKNRFGRLRTYRDVNFEGIVNALEKRYQNTESNWKKDQLGKYLSKKPCSACQGQRLNRDALAVTVYKKNLAEFNSLSIKDLDKFLKTIKLTSQEKKIANLLMKEITAKVDFLLQVGLDYLTLDRAANTLSGGESQRIRLATQIGSKLVGVLYILDEPSIGLHPRDNDRLLKTLNDLRDLGNSVIVVEHDKDTMLEADHIIDLGPGAGEAGGEIVFEGPAKDIKKSNSLTAKYLNGVEEIKTPTKRRKGDGELIIEGVKTNNLKDVDVDFKLGAFNCLTGVSGSGKSSLIKGTLYPALSNRIQKTHLITGAYKEIKGIDKVDKVISIDQSPIGRTPRSNPATYTGLFSQVRELFANTPEARRRGYKPGRFSFNVKGGRCESCQGDGQLKIEMHFLPDLYVTCQDCKGKRYNKETLEVNYKNKNISEVLEMSVTQARDFFKNITKINRRLKTLEDVGLGYIKLGQPATTLSGGEAQRIKLATELSRVATGDTVYILDEPTVGLHIDDTKKLINVLDLLVANGNTVIVIEHNLDVIRSADYIVDLGPEGGAKGGQVIARGTPEQVAKIKKSYTGQFLKKELA